MASGLDMWRVDEIDRNTRPVGHAKVACDGFSAGACAAAAEERRPSGIQIGALLRNHQVIDPQTANLVPGHPKEQTRGIVRIDVPSVIVGNEQGIEAREQWRFVARDEWGCL